MLRPIDIQNKEFEKKLKGYDCNEVDDFLDAIITDYELLCKENQALKDKLALLTEAVERYKLMEVTMRQSLDVAKQSADELRRNANIEAQGIISKAKLDASRLSKQIDDEHLKKHREMLALKTQIDSYKARVKSLTESMIQMLEDI
ncbi:MAG: DivIVA domain-containing protein [Clostridia bacterium]|nr:DivIVA domain-containing protein [Clostridia bacterium]